MVGVGDSRGRSARLKHHDERQQASFTRLVRGTICEAMMRLSNLSCSPSILLKFSSKIGFFV
jgi:hypothetical protein